VEAAPSATADPRVSTSRTARSRTDACFAVATVAAWTRSRVCALDSVHSGAVCSVSSSTSTCAGNATALSPASVVIDMTPTLEVTTDSPGSGKPLSTNNYWPVHDTATWPSADNGLVE
jgi:hypothetical protein